MKPHKDTQTAWLIGHAYNHPKYASHRFVDPAVCPQCGTEIAFVIKELDGKPRTLICQVCGMIYLEREIFAA